MHCGEAELVALEVANELFFSLLDLLRSPHFLNCFFKIPPTWPHSLPSSPLRDKRPVVHSLSPHQRSLVCWRLGPGAPLFQAKELSSAKVRLTWGAVFASWESRSLQPTGTGCFRADLCWEEAAEADDSSKSSQSSWCLWPFHYKNICISHRAQPLPPSWSGCWVSHPPD